MFGFHAPELIIILVIALLIFGPKKLPEMGSSIGRSIKEFRKGMSEISHQNEEEEENVKPVKAKAIERESVTREAGAGFEDVTMHKEVETKPVTSEILPVESHVD